MTRLFLAAALVSLPLRAPCAPDGWSRKVSVGRRAEDLIEGWPFRAERAAQAMLEKYGDPDEADAEHLAWFGNGPWKRTVVRRSGEDCVESVIAYEVPRRKVVPLGRFAENVDADPLAGELSARSESEELNFLIVNLAVDIVRGKLEPQAAREHFESMKRFPSSPYLTGLTGP